MKSSKNLNKQELKEYLNSLYVKYKSLNSSRDPIWYIHKIKDEKEIEILGLIASCYSYGNIIQINRFQETFSGLLSGGIYDFVMNFDYKIDVKYFKNLKYRFNKSEDLGCLIVNMQKVISFYGSLKNLFLEKYSANDENILNTLGNFSSKLKKLNPARSKTYSYLLPDVSKNSTCKRLNLYLRWMIRKDEIDFGIWGKEVDKSKLIIPVDTHVYRVSRQIGLMKRNSCDIKFAIELTEKLKAFDPEDPVKYDFALCHSDLD
jgi:uncharacterized protein (TIGR02757 family)